jgi:hypothetical protein
MKKVRDVFGIALVLASTLSVNGASAAGVPRNCVNDKIDEDQLYCVGDTVYLQNSNNWRESKGPYLLVDVENTSSGRVRIPGTDFEFDVIPAFEVGVTRGCGKNTDICVNDRVRATWGGGYKVIARYGSDLKDYFAIAACIDAKCDKTSLDGSYPLALTVEGSEIKRE